MSSMVGDSHGHFAASLPVRVRVVAVKASAEDALGVIRWRRDSRASQVSTLREPPPRLLTDFCRLRHPEVTPKRIAEFAEDWGVLGRHVRGRYLSEAILRRERATSGTEDCEIWRTVADVTRALAVLAVALSRGERGDGKCWDIAIAGTTWENSGVADLGRRARRQLLTALLGEWLELGSVAVTVDVEDGDPVVVVEGFGPLGGAAALLALALGSHVGVAICSHPDCHEPFIPKRRLDPLKASFCQDHHATGPTLIHKHKVRGKPKRLRKESQDGKAG